jgi:hypothetical protein
MAHPHARSLATLTASLTLGLTLAGCSLGGPSDESDSSTGADGSSSAGTSVQVRSSVARVHGQLSAPRRAQLERDASELIGGYLAAAYLHERPADGYKGSFPGFTRGAWALAMKDVDTVSDAAYADAEEVSARGAVVFLSVVAPEGRPVGATARVFLNLDISEDGRDRPAQVRGRLMLTPAGKSWKIFGYDLSLDTSPKRRSGR